MEEVAVEGAGEAGELLLVPGALGGGDLVFGGEAAEVLGGFGVAGVFLEGAAVGRAARPGWPRR